MSTTVEQIRAEIDAFKVNLITKADGFVGRAGVTAAQVSEFLTQVGVTRPESPEVVEARAELADLKARVRATVEALPLDYHVRQTALAEFGV